jgi:hypothetical protein
MDSPMIIPPTTWLRARSGLITRPTANIPSTRRTRTSPVAGSTVTSVNTALKACRSLAGWLLISWAVSTVTETGGAAPGSCWRSFAAASVIAQAHDVVPREPPASHPGPRSACHPAGVG